MMYVKQILKEKGGDIWSISPKKTVIEALRQLADKDIGALLVLDDNGKPVGIFSERDYARKIALKDHSSRDTLVEQVMTDNVLYVSPDQKIEDCMALMTYKRVRHLVVMEDDKLCGVISIGDVVKSLISHQDSIIQHLANYISGKT